MTAFLNIKVFLVVVFLAEIQTAEAFPFREEVSFNFRVAVSISHDGVKYTGSKVWSMHAWQDHVLLDNYGLKWRVTGEAIPIDMPSVGRVYYLKRSAGESSTDTFGGFPRQCLSTSVAVGGVEALADFKTPCTVRSSAPLFVTAGQAADTVKRISVEEEVDGRCSDLCFESIVIERTNDPVTRTIIDELPWLSISKVGWARIGEESPRRGFQVLNTENPTYFKQDFIVD